MASFARTDLVLLGLSGLLLDSRALWCDAKRRK
jgi:hypothetical protein